jgi:dCTP deaminase
MILTGPAIESFVRRGQIHIKPFNPENIGPNSYDLTLAPELLIYRHEDGNYPSPKAPLDVKAENPTATIQIPEDGLVLRPGILYLGSTIEEAGSDLFVPCIEGRSSIGRLGIASHVAAGFGDIGFKQRWTLEITVVHPTRIYAGIRICQVYFHRFEGDRLLYGERPGSKYAHSDGVEPSRSYLDFSGRDDGNPPGRDTLAAATG